MDWQNMFTVAGIILGIATLFTVFTYSLLEGQHKKLMLAAFFIATLACAILAAGLS